MNQWVKKLSGVFFASLLAVALNGKVYAEERKPEADETQISEPAPVVTDPVTVCYDYYEPDYIIVDGARVYSDGTVVYDNDIPVYIDENGNNYYTDGTVITPDCAPGYYWVNGVLVYGG